MDKETLKRRVCEFVEKNFARFTAIGEQILHNPELSYREVKTAALAKGIFEELGLPVKEGLSITGLRADLATGRPGPRVAVLGELDALIVPGHPFADPTTGAAHACGHHAAFTSMLGAAIALCQPEVRAELCGDIAFIATPSEECQNQDYIADLIRQGKLHYFSGKSDMLYNGVFDDVDVALVSHASEFDYLPTGSNGFVMKHLHFHGKAAHAGSSPDKGVNAATMMRATLSLIDAQRDTFRDENHVRIHGYIADGGAAVNVVPEHAMYVMQVRGATPEAVADAAAKVDRCCHAAAVAFGGRVEVRNIFGFMPLKAYTSLDTMHLRNFRLLEGDEAPFREGVFDCGSTDMGDVSMVVPSLHMYFTGFQSHAHAIDFLVTDKHTAYATSVKMMALDVIDLLYGDAALGRQVAAEKTPMTKAEYIAAMDAFTSTRVFDAMTAE